MISLNKLPTLITFFPIKLGESNMTRSDNIAILFLLDHPLLLQQDQLIKVMDKTHGIHTETGLEIPTQAAAIIITGTSTETTVITTQGKIIRTTFTNNSGIGTEVDTKKEPIIVARAEWEVGLETLNRSCKRC